MRKIRNIFVFIFFAGCFSILFATTSDSPRESYFVPIFMIISGLCIAALWTMDLIRAEKVDFSEGFFMVKDTDDGQRLLPHLIAEYATAGCLLAGGVGIFRETTWARDISLIGLGALAYTSMNSLSWVITKRERMPYGVPMVVSLVGAIISLGILL